VTRPQRRRWIRRWARRRTPCSAQRIRRLRWEAGRARRQRGRRRQTRCEGRPDRLQTSARPRSAVAVMNAAHRPNRPIPPPPPPLRSRRCGPRAPISPYTGDTTRQEGACGASVHARTPTRKAVVSDSMRRPSAQRTCASQAIKWQGYLPNHERLFMRSSSLDRQAS